MNAARRRERPGFGRPPPTLEAEVDAVPSAVTDLRHRALDFARSHVDRRVAEDVALAISEAVTNAVRHGYNGRPAGLVRLSGATVGDWLEFSVSDDGHGFLEGAPGGLGLGLPIIAEICSDLEISQGAEGTVLRMRFPLSRSAAERG